MFLRRHSFNLLKNYDGEQGKWHAKPCVFAALLSRSLLANGRTAPPSRRPCAAVPLASAMAWNP